MMTLLGSLMAGVFVGAAAGIFLQPGVRQQLSFAARIRLLGLFLGIVMAGGGGGAAGLTFLVDPEAAGFYLGGLLPGGLLGFLYMEREQKEQARSDARKVVRSKPGRREGTVTKVLTDRDRLDTADGRLDAIQLLDALSQAPDEPDTKAPDPAPCPLELTSEEGHVLERVLNGEIHTLNAYELDILRKLLDRLDP